MGWLMAPHVKQPGTSMPDLLPLEDQARRESATALAHFLFSISAPPIAESPAAGSSGKGRHLFHTIGCVACHSPDPEYEPSLVESGAGLSEGVSVPLIRLSQKYTREGLAAFLRDPIKFRPSAAMPRTPLTQAELGDLLAWLWRPETEGEQEDERELRGGGEGNLLQLDPALISRGREQFAQLGCVQCHALPGEKLPGFRGAKPLAELAGLEGGCLSPNPPDGAPRYSLDAIQREALQAALSAIENRKPPTAEARIERDMLLLNCYACHARHELGGPDPARMAYFETTGADIEDEGRFPPTLTGVGRKLTRRALVEIVQGNEPVRPYMSTRMPDFGVAAAEQFATRFAEADLARAIKPTPRDGQENLVGRGPWGRELMGVGGLNCISCHDLNGRPSLGIRAMDLAAAPGRLRPEWFRDYLIDPAGFRPGTRMPSFWPGGKASHPLIGRDTERQIDSLWVYLNEIDQSRWPEGMEDMGGFELKPDAEPMVFRTFLKGAGFHAIAVGFPEGVHAAFDGEHARWAMAWQGRFLDAESTWSDRFTPLTAPLGTNVITFPAPFTRAPRGARDGEPPAAGAYRMQGYRLDPRGVPTFLYRWENIAVEDRFEPMEPRGQALRRVIEISGEGGRLLFGAATAKQIVRESKDTWRADNMRIWVSEPDDAFMNEQNGTAELLLPVSFNAGRTARLVIEIKW
jgi:mono/diheme cytochrome c family protein